MDTEFFEELDKFTLLMKKRVSTAYTGARRSLRVGRGISPVGYREYRKGDDFKLVDWKVFARKEKLYVREHEEEKSLVVHILLDSSASMGYGDKFSFASKIAAGFAYLATRENEKFSISVFGETLDPGEAKRGRKYLFRSIDELDGIIPQGTTNIKRAAGQFDKLIRSTSLVVLISDFLDDIEDIISAIYRLSGHDLILIQVLDEDEAKLGFGGDVRFVDMESGGSLVTRISPRLRDEYRHRLKTHEEKIAETCQNAGVDFFSFTTDKSVFDAIFDVSSRANVWRS
jgi:uncharacterized protein (DUF58 family)